MRKNSFSLLFSLILMFIILSCKKENNRISNSTYTIDSIEVFLDTIKQLSLIPGDLSVFDSVKQMGDTTSYYLFANYDYNVHFGTIGGTAQKPRFLVKNNHIIGLDYYLPFGTYGQDGNEYRKIKFHYNAEKLDSINQFYFSFMNISYDEILFNTVIRTPDSYYITETDSGDIKNNLNLYYNYSGNNLINMKIYAYYQNTPILNNAIRYAETSNQNNIIGIDVNQLIINSVNYMGLISGDAGTNAKFAFPIMMVNLGVELNFVADKLITSIDTSTINYNFDALNNNRISTIEFPDYITNQKLKYIFHYKN